MKEATRVNIDGLYVEPIIVPLSRMGVTEIRELLPAEPDEEPEEDVTGYVVAEKVPDGLFRPRWDFSLWEDYQAALNAVREDYDQALADWYALPEEDRGERPVYAEPVRPECWIEGLPQEEIDDLRNAPIPLSPEERIAQLEAESVEVMLGLTEIYETLVETNPSAVPRLQRLMSVFSGGKR